jgi:hypothetical protein
MVIMEINYILGYYALQTVEIQPTFRRNICSVLIATRFHAEILLGLFFDPFHPPPSSGSKNKPSKIPA